MNGWWPNPTSPWTGTIPSRILGVVTSWPWSKLTTSRHDGTIRDSIQNNVLFSTKHVVKHDTLFCKSSLQHLCKWSTPLWADTEASRILGMVTSLPDLKSTIQIKNLYRRLPGTPKSMKIHQIMKGHVRKFWGRVCCRKNSSCGRTLNRKGLVRCNEIIQNDKNTSFDNLKPFSDSYSTIWDNSTVNERGPAS